MSVNVPFDIQEEIMKRIVSVKSLLRFRSVSKQWKSLIDSSEFITSHHNVNRTQPHQHLLFRYEDHADHEYKYVSIVDDESFPQHKFNPTLPPTFKLYKSTAFIVDNGLVCLNGYDRHGKELIVIWNPSIRKSVGIVLSSYSKSSTYYGFAVCPKTSDPKIVSIRCRDDNGIKTVDFKVKVFTLSSGYWRRIPMSSSYRIYKSHQVVIDGVIHWVAYCDQPSKLRYYLLVLSFDSTSEELGEVYLPDSLEDKINFKISKLKDSVAVLDVHRSDEVCDVWLLMKNSFAKLFSVSLMAYDGCQLSFTGVLGFRKNGQPIMRHTCHHKKSGSLVSTLEAYEPSTKHSSDLGIYTPSHTYPEIADYTESLLLLNYSGSTIQRYDDDYDPYAYGNGRVCYEYDYSEY